MNQLEYITVQDLYAYAKERKLLDARIRICDGMAVSYYPDPHAVCTGRYEIIIDVSANQPIEYDDLDLWAQRQYESDRTAQTERLRQDTIRAQQQKYMRLRQSHINAAYNPDSIYGYGPYRPHKRRK